MDVEKLLGFDVPDEVRAGVLSSMRRMQNGQQSGKQRGIIHALAHSARIAKRLSSETSVLAPMVSELFQELLKTAELEVASVGLCEASDNTMKLADFESIFSEYEDVRDLMEDSPDHAKPIVDIFLLKLNKISQDTLDRQSELVQSIVEKPLKVDEMVIYKLADDQVSRFQRRFPRITVFKVNPFLIAVSTIAAVMLTGLEFRIERVVAVRTDGSIESQSSFVVNYRFKLPQQQAGGSNDLEPQSSTTRQIEPPQSEL